MFLTSFPPAVLCFGAPFPPPGPQVGFPGFIGTMRRSDFLPPFPHRSGCPLRCQYLLRGGGRTSQVPGEPLQPCSVLRLRWAEPLLAFNGEARCCLKAVQNPWPHGDKFRSSIAEPTSFSTSCLLSTLRSLGYPRSTQDSLPACWLGFDRVGVSPTGLHPRVSMKSSATSFLPSQAFLAHCTGYLHPVLRSSELTLRAHPDVVG